MVEQRLKVTLESATWFLQNASKDAKGKLQGQKWKTMTVRRTKNFRSLKRLLISSEKRVISWRGKIRLSKTKTPKRQKTLNSKCFLICYCFKRSNHVASLCQQKVFTVGIVQSVWRKKWTMHSMKWQVKKVVLWGVKLAMSSLGHKLDMKILSFQITEPSVKSATMESSTQQQATKL